MQCDHTSHGHTYVFLITCSCHEASAWCSFNHLADPNHGKVYYPQPDGSLYLYTVRVLHQHLEQVFLTVVCLQVLSNLLPTILNFFDSLFCWCSPGFLGEGMWTVFDPEHPESNLALRDGNNVVDLDEEDGEQLANIDDAVPMGIQIS